MSQKSKDARKAFRVYDLNRPDDARDYLVVVEMHGLIDSGDEIIFGLLDDEKACLLAREVFSKLNDFVLIHTMQ